MCLQDTCPPFRESISWIISPFKFWTATIFLHAHLQVVYYKCVKFHKNPIIRLGVALTMHMDGQTGWFLYTPPNFVCGGYKNLCEFRWTINSPCTKDRNTHFCTLGPIVWKWLRVQYPKFTPTFILRHDLYVKNAEDNRSTRTYSMETILSTDRRWQHHNIIWLHKFFSSSPETKTEIQIRMRDSSIPQYSSPSWLTIYK